MATNPDRASYFPAIEKKYGQPMSYWFDQMAQISDRRYPEQIAFLKENHGFSQAHANALVMYSRGSTSARRHGTLDDYLDQFDDTKDATVRAILKAITSKYRKAEVVIAWNQPMVKIDGQYVFGVSVLTNHILIAPWGGVLDEFRPRLVDYKVNKKTIQVPVDWKPDVQLIRDMVAARIEENAAAPVRRAQSALRDLDEVAAGVVEHGDGDRAHLDGLHREPHAEPPEPRRLGDDVVHGERRAGDAVADQRRLVGLGGRVGVGLEQQLGAVRIVGRDHRQPPVLAERHVVLDDEAEHVGVEALGLRLIVDEHAGQVYPHANSAAAVVCDHVACCR